MDASISVEIVSNADFILLDFSYMEDNRMAEGQLNVNVGAEAVA